MRLFVAVNFDEKTKNMIARTKGELQKVAEKGSFTRIGNLHMTLQFIGETERISQAEDAVAAVDFESFFITFDRISSFRRQGSELCWLGVSDERELARLSSAVGAELKRRGFRLEERPFAAHLTLGRGVVFKNGCGYDRIKLPAGMGAAVERISLMKSERIKGILTYSEIYGKNASNL